MKFYSKFVVQAVLAVAVSGSANASSVDFFRALDIDNERTVKSLLAEGFDPNTRDEKGQVPLYVALRAESRRVANAIAADPRTRIDEPNAAGETPLMMAALKGQLDWVARLVQMGAQVNRPGWSPLLYAASGPEPRTVVLLLDRGADIESRAPNGDTALMLAARYGSEASVNVLLDRGADPRRRNERGFDAASFARAAGRESLAERLAQAAR